MGITLAKRILVDNATIPDVTSVSFDNPLEVPLIECLETMDEEVESDGAGAIADVPLYSRFISIKLKCIVNAQQTNTFRWMLYKEPDGESLVTNLATQFHTSDDNPTAREVRKYTLAKGWFVVNPSSLIREFTIRPRRSALARCSPMRESDRITFVIAKDSNSTTSILHMMGTAYVKANA